MSDTGIITNIQRCSTEDGPGIRTTVFMKGCPLHCIWCHNIETIDAAPRLIWHKTKCIADKACIKSCPENALELTSDGMQIDLTACNLCGRCTDACPTGAMEIMGTTREVEELVEDLLRDKVFFETSNGGVTISGGEPLQQADFVMKIAACLREHEVHVALDTTAYANEATWRSMLGCIDLVLLDIKHLDPPKHLEYTRIPLDRILANIEILASMNVPTWVRTPIIPKHTDSRENIRAISKYIKNTLPNNLRYDLLAFNKMCVEKYQLFGLEYPLKDLDLVERDYMEELATIARSEGLDNVVWSGMTKYDKDDENAAIKTEVNTCG